MDSTDYTIYHIHFVYDKPPLPGWEDIRHKLNVHSLYWIYGGQGTFTTEEGSYEVHKGMMVYLKPELKLRMKSDFAQPLHVMMLLLDVARISFMDNGTNHQTEMVEILELPFIQMFSQEQEKQINERIRYIALNWTQDQSVHRIEIQYELASLIARMSGFIQKTDNFQEAYTGVRKWIDIHYSEELKIVELADRFGISPSHLRSWFLKELGIPPKEYLNRVRNEHAKKYLTLTVEPMRSIAEACGFSDEHHFGKMFRKWNRISPAKYRSNFNYIGQKSPSSLGGG
ncbi:helix-turn-helix transcriptional regulator [Paenibacillus alkaliterrae]|uniref:helix-turn-helix transcriptional regulator n=1 Tax=Paenibacillus alkaliterrae TaxID=320909 RepID=UPI001F20883F|nr:helix-turn-helix transcriptional regulator [Paenibacillus alkaliterrae]MCF2941056.1 helix-turn-helix transcriptional regulator [Paenibacillus alkaliterrae]